MGHLLSRSPALAAAAVVAAVLSSGLTGCESSPAPGPMPKAQSTVPEPSPSPSPSAPTMPAAAKGSGAKAAKAFARYWIESLNYAGNSGDTYVLRNISSRSCKACAAIANFVDRVYRNGGTIRGDGWELMSLKVVSSAGPRKKTVDALVTVHQQTVIARRGDKPNHYAGGRRLKTLWLATHEGSWKVERLDQPE